MNQIIEDLNWRYAVKKYNSSKTISKDDLETLKETIRLSPSSKGLQPYKVLIVEDKKIRKQLRTKSYGQSQITDASHLFVFCNLIEINDNYIDSIIENTATIRNQNISELNSYKEFLGSSTKMDSEKRDIWNAKQSYIALGHLMQTAAQLRIDSTPMEGFDSNAYDEILNLSKFGLKSNLVCALGFRSEDDKYQQLKKVRKGSKEMFVIV